MIGDIAALLAANVGFLAVGLGLTRGVGLWTGSRGALSWLPVAYMVGVGTVGIAAELALIAGLSLQLWQIALGCCVLASVGAVLRRDRDEPGPDIGWISFSGQRILAIGLGVLLALLLVETAFQALDTWDAWAMWTMKARALVLLNGLDPSLFANAAYAPHIDYPLLLPALQAIDFRAMASLNTQVIHLQSALLLVGWVTASARLLSGRAERLTVLPALGLALVAPATLTLIEEGYADIPGALFMALAALCAWLYLEEPSLRWAALVAVFATAGASTKREAWTFALGLFVVTLIYGARRKVPLGPLVAGLVLFVFTIGSWLAWLASNGVSGHDDEPIGKTLDPGYLAGRVDRAFKAVYWLANYSLRPSLWLIGLPLTLIVAVIAVKTGNGRSVALFLLPLLAVEYAALVWAFWISRPAIGWHLAHAAPRVVSTPIFVAVTFLPLLLSPDRNHKLQPDLGSR